MNAFGMLIIKNWLTQLSKKQMSFSCIKLNLDYFGGQNLNTILSTSLYQLSCNSGCNRLNAKTTVLPFRDDLMLQ